MQNSVNVSVLYKTSGGLMRKLRDYGAQAFRLCARCMYLPTSVIQQAYGHQMIISEL